MGNTVEPFMISCLLFVGELKSYFGFEMYFLAVLALKINLGKSKLVHSGEVVELAGILGCRSVIFSLEVSEFTLRFSF